LVKFIMWLCSQVHILKQYLDFVQLTAVSLVAQTVFSPPHCPPTWSVLHQLVSQDAVGYSVERLDKVQTNRIHCSPLIYQCSHLIIEDYQVRLDLSFVKPCWLLPIIILCLLC